MCCEDCEPLDLPAAVVETIARYRRLAAERGVDWGDERVEFSRFARFSLIGPLFAAYMTTGDWSKAIRSVVGDDLPTGFVVVRIDTDGHMTADVGPARLAVDGHPVTVDIVLDSAVDAELSVTVAGADTAAGTTVTVPKLGAQVHTIDIDGADPVFTVSLRDQTLRVEDAARTCPSTVLRLSSPHCARWSVTDDTGGAWFPEGLPQKWDFHGVPFFHGHDMSLRVPAVPLTVSCTRGIEFDRIERRVDPGRDGVEVVECAPPRLVDPAADGWYGGDLHVHLNYSGDMVCTPADAARMQHGEGLHLMNLVAGNFTTSLVYEREMLDAYAGKDLPWSNGDVLARMGVEFRNDLLGHVHALDPAGSPTRFYGGHERSDHPHDWPPNSAACEELRDLGATVGYAHPALTDFADWSTERFFQAPRTTEARELVADAALGLVDSIDLISPFNDEGAVFLYHRLLSCGLRLAATAGTDTFLSFSRLTLASNPPGWGRVYAYLGDQGLSAAGFKEAIRAGRTVVTNGPWLTLEVNGERPGAVLDLDAGDRLDIRADVTGPGADRLAIVGPDGLIAEGEAGSGLRVETTVDAAAWIAAVARGTGHPSTLDEAVLAHTSPVYVDVAGERVARRADATWCLTFLDSLVRFVDEHGRFDDAERTARVSEFDDVVERARAYYRRVAEAAPPRTP